MRRRLDGAAQGAQVPAPPAPERDSAPLLELRAVWTRFGGLTVVSALDLHVDEGEIVSVIGPNGAGKTTLFNLITGVYAPDEGEIEFEGRSIERNTPAFVRPYAAAITLSFTDMFRKRRSVWNVRAIPRLQISCGSSPPRLAPSKRSSPESGG